MFRGLGLAGIALVATAVPAAQDTFNWSIELGGGYTDNVEYSADQVSDHYRAVRLTLPYVHRTESQRLSLSYRPGYVRYREAETLDHDEHRLTFDLDSRLSRKTQLRSRAGFTRTQARGTPESSTDPDLFLTTRNDTDLYMFDVTLEQTISPRWNWEASLDGEAYFYDPIPGVDGSASDVEDRTQYGGGLHASRAISSTASFGLRYEFHRFDLEDSGQEDAHQLDATYEKRLAERLSLFAALGGFHTRGEAAGEDESQSGVSGELSLSRNYEALRLELNAFHRPSSGGALTGTATQTRISLELSSAESRVRWHWSAAPYFGRRTSSSEGRDEIDATGIRADVERRFAWSYGIRLGTHWFDQSDEESVFNVNASFLWYPFGAREIGGRSG
jgi:hypothetical protein